MPLSWVMGVPWEQCEDVGTLIGLKTVVNELVAYQRMGEYKRQRRIFGKAETIATFAVCGFANPGSIGIQIGCLSSLAPEKKEQITKVVVRAFFAGTAVCFLTASVAGKAEILSVTAPERTIVRVTVVFATRFTLSIKFHYYVAGILTDEILVSNSTMIPNTTEIMTLNTTTLL